MHDSNRLWGNTGYHWDNKHLRDEADDEDWRNKYIWLMRVVYLMEHQYIVPLRITSSTWIASCLSLVCASPDVCTFLYVVYACWHTCLHLSEYNDWGSVDTFIIYSLCILVLVCLTTVNCFQHCVLSTDSLVQCPMYGVWCLFLSHTYDCPSVRL